jgi:hypothetical protein
MKLPGRPRSRCENNIKTDLIESGLESGDRIHVAQDKVVLKKGSVPYSQRDLGLFFSFISRG